MNNDLRIWKPVSINDNWLSCDTSRLDDIKESWYRRRESLIQNSKAYEKFITRLKREHAIETGIIENIYDLGKGITETFIKEGFVKSYLSHGDTNINEDDLLLHLSDHLESVDFVFDIVKENRPLTVGFIKELHHLVTRNQKHAEGRDQFGNKFQIKLLKGKFKERENNPTTKDGGRILYCPPEHVDAEMDRLILLYNKLESDQVNPLIISAWLHHAFTAIHPFQDGNGRVARLLTSLIFIKHHLFPFTVLREDAKVRYIKSLEQADQEEPQNLVSYFGDVQVRNIQQALNIREITNESLTDAQRILAERLEQTKSKASKKRNRSIKDGRLEVFQFCHDKMKGLSDGLSTQLANNAEVSIEAKLQNNTENLSAFKYAENLIDYSNECDYFYNRSYPSGYIELVIHLGKTKKYYIVVCLHHYGYDNSTLAIGSFVNYQLDNAVPEKLQRSHLIYPHVISIVNNNIAGKQKNLEAYLEKVFTDAISMIASEL